MFNRKKGLLILVLMFILVLTGCGAKTNTPDATVDTMFTSVKKLDFKTLQSITVDGVEDEIDTGIMDSDNFDELRDIDFKKVDGAVKFQSNLKNILKNLKHKVTNTVEDADTAIVTVEAEYVDGGELVAKTLGDFIGQAMGAAFSGDTDEMIPEETISILAEAFNKNYDGFEKTMKTETVDINLIKDKDGKWLVSEIDEDLINILVFNAFKGIENMLGDMFSDFE